MLALSEKSRQVPSKSHYMIWETIFSLLIIFLNSFNRTYLFT